MDYKPFRFSQALIDRTIQYFKEKHNHEISEDTANEYLHSFADLYLSFAELAGSKKKDGK